MQLMRNMSRFLYLIQYLFIIQFNTMLKPQLNSACFPCHIQSMHLCKPANCNHMATSSKLCSTIWIPLSTCNKPPFNATSLTQHAWEGVKKTVKKRDGVKEIGWSPLTLTVLGRGV